MAPKPIFRGIKMKVLVKVEKHGITIPIQKLKGINESEFVEIEIKKVYVDDDVKKSLNFAFVQ
jgi:hypothetical protein